MNCCVFCVV